MNLYKRLAKNSIRKQKTVIFPESEDDRVIEAVRIILKERLAKVILIDDADKIEKMIPAHRNLTVIDPAFAGDFTEYLTSLNLKSNKDRTREQIRKSLKDRLLFACILLRKKFADGIIAGSVYSTSDVLRNAISVIGTAAKTKTVSSFFLFTFPAGHPYRDRVFAYADCGVIPDPDAEQLSEIAYTTAMNFRKLTGIKPRVAFLSFSTKGSASHSSADKMKEALRITLQKHPGLICDGELQFDAAAVPSVAARKNPGGRIKGDANVFIFPDLNSGNISYKVTERIGQAEATGPIVQGLAMPVMDLSRGCNANDIVNMTKVITNL